MKLSYILKTCILIRKLQIPIVGFILLALFNTALAQNTGTISGKIKDAKTGEALISANVILKDTKLGDATDLNGNYSIKLVPSGTYTMLVSLVGYKTIEQQNVNVVANQTTALDVILEESQYKLGDITVYGASRRIEKLTEAPSAVTVIGLEDIKLNSGQGQIPLLLASIPGVDLVQNDVQDFNLNTRGFNSSVTRRVLVLLDGRDLSASFLGQQEWGSITMPLDDIERIEFVRGPSSALYGTNAFNGVLNISTLSPKQSIGTKVSLSGGERNLTRIDVRQGGLLGSGWSYKVNLGRLQTKGWTISRTSSPFEYTGLSTELRPFSDKSEIFTYGSARLDYDLSDGSVITAEGGLAIVENTAVVTGIGRLEIGKGSRPWARLHFGSKHLDVQLYGQRRTTPGDIYSLASGGRLVENSTTTQIEAQYNTSFFEDKLRFILGGSQKYNYVDMENTAMVGTRDYSISGLYSQIEVKPIPELKIVAAGRMDRTTYEKARFSPRAAAVLSFAEGHSLRVSYNRAFLLPSTSEYFLNVLAGGASLGALGINPGKATRILALGNEKLSPELIQGFEVGYKGIFLDNKLFLTVDGYSNKVENFITDLIQGINPIYPFGGAPAGLAELIRNGSPANGIPAIPGLTVLPSGETAIVLSYMNKGRVDTRGLEVAFNYYLTDELHIDANWSYFDYEVKEQQAGDQLLPNNPKHKFGYGIKYQSEKGWEVGLSGRTVQSFKWAAGVFVGQIPELTLFNLAAGYQISRQYRFGINITNLLDRQTYQIFGGSIVGRQAIATLTMSF